MTAQERWQAHVTAWASSGLSCKDYAARVGVNPRTLTWWKSKLGSIGTAGPAPASFVEVTGQIAAPAGDEAGVIELDVARISDRACWARSGSELSALQKYRRRWHQQALAANVFRIATLAAHTHGV